MRLLIKADADVNQATVCTLDGGVPRTVRLSVLCESLSGVDGAAVYVYGVHGDLLCGLYWVLNVL